MKGLREHRGQVDLVNGSQNQRMHEVVYYISSGKMRGIVQRANVPSVSLTECSTDEDQWGFVAEIAGGPGDSCGVARFGTTAGHDDARSLAEEDDDQKN
uniref:Uncharacterized protein n=1 Tax=Oryza sativa subsp. japonica TaxID=39947 RepID=Q69P26_ORYSJ|nr:hypothetical protein [Oryza sativa Japonica Group]